MIAGGVGVGVGDRGAGVGKYVVPVSGVYADVRRLIKIIRKEGK